MLQKYLLRKPLSKNQVDDMVDGLVNVMRYADSSILYPTDIESAQPNSGVDPEWIYPIHNGSNAFYELSAIHMYTTQEATFEDIGQLMLGIGIVEMQHYGKLSEFIRAIGGTLEHSYDNEEVEIGGTPEEVLRIALDGKEKTIEFYESLAEKIESVKQTPTTRIALQLLAKLRADELVHVKLLRKKLETYGSKEKR